MNERSKVASAYRTGDDVRVRTVYHDEERWTVYHDEERFIVTRANVAAKGDGGKVAARFFDQLGRVRLAKTLEDAATQSATNETDGIKVQARYKTVNGFTYQLTSNPYRADYSSNAGSEESMGWTLSTVWNTGRHSEVETFAGAALPAAFGGNNTASTGVVRTDLDADRTLVTDQAGKQRISKTNALGQLTDVWEIVQASDASTESVTFPGTSITYGYKTSYVYDPLNNLTTVNQGVQTRTFVYSSLSRLLAAQNPESGTILYGYDPNGNLTSKTDARNITTGYSYDALNRVTQRTYSDSTLPVYYTYDNLSHAKGKLTKVTTGSGSTPFSVTEYTEFDNVGRVKKSRQTTDGTAYNEMEYTYNVSGAMVEEKYPSGRVVRNVLDNEGDLSMVQSKKTANHGYWNYAHHFSYTAAGAVSSMQLGNGTWEKTAFNSRLQPTQIALGKVQNATDLLKLDYTYGVVESGTLNTAKNNGNIQSQTITVPDIAGSNGFTAVQTYNYDALNRIDDATEMVTPAGSTTATLSWRQDYSFDRFGNRNFVEANTTTIPKNCGTSPNLSVCPADRKVFNPSISPPTNRINLEQDGDSVNDYAFDAAGNTTRDALLRKFTYDAENKQTKVESINSSGAVTGTIGEYFYDGDGRRVKKIAYTNNQATETTVFVYDASSRLVAEYSTNLNPTPRVAYLTNDHLGSPRINTNELGAVISRRDYRPYGEEVAERMFPGYVNDTIQNRFTGFQRDWESSLDYAQNRMFSEYSGRFTRPDGFALSILSQGAYWSSKLFNVQPQNWNGYSYCRNVPTILVDRDGNHPVLAAAVAVVVSTAVRAAGGAIVGAAFGAVFETGRQALFEEKFDPRKIGGAAIQGAIFGAVAGATAGLSLPWQVGLLGAGNMVGGIGNRAFVGNPNRPALDSSSLLIDGVAGGVGGFLAPKGTSMYLGATNAQRDIAAGQVEILMAASPVPGMLPTLTKPVVNGAIQSEVYHGYAQNLSNGIVRGASKSGTSYFLGTAFDWLFGGSQPRNQPSGKAASDNVMIQAGCTVTTDDKGTQYKMCGPVISN